MTTFFPIDRDIGPFQVPVMVSEELSNRLEVPEEWQFEESYAGRCRLMLDQAAEAIKHAPANAPVLFDVVLPSNLTRQPELLHLTIRYDGEDYLVEFVE